MGSQPPSARQGTKSLADIQSEVCDTTVRIMGVLALPALLISLSRVLEIGWQIQYTAQVIAAIGAWGVTLLRHRLSFDARANTVLVLLFWLGWTGQVFSGSPTSLVYYVSASAMATVFYGARGGILAVTGSLVLTGSTYFGLIYGLYPEPRAISQVAVTTWLARGTSLVMASVGPVVALVQFRTSLLRELHRAEAASAAKSAFLAMMSHELRTPMTAIIGIAQMLEQEPMAPDQTEKVRRISSSGNSLLTLLNDVLDFAKIDAAQMTIDAAPFSLDEVLEDVRDLFAALAAEKGLDLKVQRAPGQDAFVGDAARLSQIVRNLVGNAIKFTERGHVAILVTQKPAASGKIQLRIAVADSGPGIAKADQAQLFQPFVQGETLPSRRHGGTGLGLAISRSLARIMGGDITLVSEPEHGSVFILELPLAKSSSTVYGQDHAEPVGAAREPLRVLAAEDNEAIRFLMKGMFDKRGHRVDCVEDGALAVEAIKTKVYDVVVMDMHMPVMDGVTAAKAIRALSGAAAKVPIIALTAGLTENERAAYIAAGVDQIVAKPAHWPSLFAAVESRARVFAHAEKPAGEGAPAPEETPGGTTLDEELLSGLEEAVGVDQLARMLVTMRQSLDGYHACLKDAAAAGDLTAARRAGHGLKGASRQFGGAELARIGARIENGIGSVDELGEAVPEIAPALARFDAALKARTQARATA